jgi:FixJ family two-component response regulator
MSKTVLASVVYIVDADESVRQGLSRLVGSADFATRTCGTMDAFVHETPEANAVCALLDVSELSDCDPKLWSRLRAFAAAFPVIALSARDDLATRRTARALGAQAFFRKPVDAAALLDSIAWVVRAEAPGKSS